LAELRGTLTPAQAARWAEVKAAHVRTGTLGGPDDDALTRAVAALAVLGERIAAVESAITRAADPRRLLAGPPAPPPAGGDETRWPPARAPREIPPGDAGTVARGGGRRGAGRRGAGRGDGTIARPRPVNSVRIFTTRPHVRGLSTRVVEMCTSVFGQYG